MHTSKPKIAIVHDWLTNFAGAEQVVMALLEVFPEAPIFTSLYKPEKFPEIFKNRKVYTSSLQKFPIAKHQLLFPFMGKAFEEFDLSDFDIIISSSHASSKGVITKPETLHICYCHTPTRYLWSHYHEYLNQMEFGILNPLIRWRMPKIAYNLRMWDRLAADRVDLWIANSQNTAKRIKKYYRADSEVIYPPINTDFFNISNNVQDYYFICSRLIPYKKIDLVIEAFNKLKLPLKIAGTGSIENDLKNIANDNIEFLGRVSDNRLRELYSNAKAFIFPTEEDFGITPVESMASGRPVIAYNKGGAKETVAPKVSGLLFDEQTAESLISTIREFEKTNFDPSMIRNNATKFSKNNFKEKIENFVFERYKGFLDERHNS